MTNPDGGLLRTTNFQQPSTNNPQSTTNSPTPPTNVGTGTQQANQPEPTDGGSRGPYRNPKRPRLSGSTPNATQGSIDTPAPADNAHEADDDDDEDETDDEDEASNVAIHDPLAPIPIITLERCRTRPPPKAQPEEEETMDDSTDAEDTGTENYTPIPIKYNTPKTGRGGTMDQSIPKKNNNKRENQNSIKNPNH